MISWSATGLRSNNAVSEERGTFGVGAFLAVVAAAVATLPAVAQPWFGDVFWQITEGREILAGHLPTTVPYAISAGRWIDHEWLFEVCVAAAYDHHAYPLIVLACALFGAAIPLLIFLGSRRGGNAVGAGAAALLGALAMFRYDAIRPLQFGAFAFALTMYLIRTKRLHPLPAFVLATVWGNMHASVVIAPLTCLIFAAGAAWEKQRADAERFARMAGAMLAGSLCSPTGVALYGFALMHVGPGGAIDRYLDEWQPFRFAAPIDWIAVGTLGCAVLAGWRDRALPLAERAICLVFFALLFAHGRQIAFVVPAAAAVAAAAFGGLRAAIAAPRGFAIAAWAILAWTAYADRTLMSASPLTDHRDLVAVFDALEQRHLGGNAYVDYNVAAYSAFRGAPFSLLIDSHAAPYSATIWRDWSTLRNVEPGWHRVLTTYRLALVLVKEDSALAQILAVLPDWEIVARSGRYVAYSPARKSSSARSSSPASAAIETTRSRAAINIVR